MDQKITRIISIVIGFIIAVLIIVMGFKLVQNTFIRAEDVTPQEVIVADINQNSAKITWVTGRETQSVVEYGTTPTALNFFSPETQKTTSHTADLTLLSPSTTYYFQIRVGDKKFDNGGVPWTFNTKGKVESQPLNLIPTQSVVIPTQPAAVNSSCQETDCDRIKQKIGSGCSSIDYIQCVRKNPTPTLISAPRVTVAPTSSATPSATTTP